MIYEEHFECNMQTIHEKLKMELFIWLIFKDILEILWILRENNIVQSQLNLQSIYLKNGYFKLGCYENMFEYGTKNEKIKENISKKALDFMPPEYFLN